MGTKTYLSLEGGGIGGRVRKPLQPLEGLYNKIYMHYGISSIDGHESQLGTSKLFFVLYGDEKIGLEILPKSPVSKNKPKISEEEAMDFIRNEILIRDFLKSNGKKITEKSIWETRFCKPKSKTAEKLIKYIEENPSSNTFSII